MSRRLIANRPTSFPCAGLASTYPEPKDIRKWLTDQLYNANYESALPATWQWPQNQSEPIKMRPINPTKLYSAKK